MIVSVMGLGYVGTSVASAVLDSGFELLPIDTDPVAIEKFVVSTPMKLRNQIKLKPRALDEVDVVVICVPTPLNPEGKPDYSHVEEAAANSASLARNGGLVVLESTVAPGTLRGLVAPILRKAGGGKVFQVAFSPERIDPGNESYGFRNTPKIVAGIDSASTGIAVDFYSSIGAQCVVADSVETAEFAKLLENTYRLVNISMINELAQVSQQMGVDIFQAIEIAGTKPFGFQKFYPGVGAGGHCIPVDPIFLQEAIREILPGTGSAIIDESLNINLNLIDVWADRISTRARQFTVSQICFVGIGYKPFSSDTRESQVLKIAENLVGLDFEVCFFDEHVDDSASFAIRQISSFLELDQALVVGHKVVLERVQQHLSNFSQFVFENNVGSAD